MEKINIYVPEQTGMMLENDAAMFEVYKKDDRTVNKNRFLESLIQGYYDEYNSNLRGYYDRIVAAIECKNLSDLEKEQIASTILREVIQPKTPPRKGKNPIKLSYKPTKDAEPLVEHIITNLAGDDFISQYFCKLFMSYCEKPFSKREQIIYRDNYDALQMACSTQRSVTFKTKWNKAVIHEVIPYKVTTGREEMFNYLLCAEVNPMTGEQEARSYRLNRIEKVNFGRNMSSIRTSVRRHLDMMIQYGPAYAINDDTVACVRLTNSGVLNYQRIYFGRPAVDHIEEKEDGKYYYFKGSLDQIFLYFRRFIGSEAVIVSPLKLRMRMMEFHKDSLDNYQEER